MKAICNDVHGYTASHFSSSDKFIMKPRPLTTVQNEVRRGIQQDGTCPQQATYNFLKYSIWVNLKHQRKTMPAMEMDIKQKPLTGLCILSVNFQSFLFMKHNSSYTAMAILGFPVGSSSQRWFIPPLLRVLTSRPVLFPVFLHIFTKLRLSIWLHLIYIPKLKTNLKNN